MKIQNIFQLVEQTLIEISKYGGESATHMTDKDYEKVRQFLGKIAEKARMETDDPNVTLQNLDSALQLIKNDSAEQYMFGKSASVKKSAARSSDRGDDERRIPAFAGPEEKVQSVSSEKAEITKLAAGVLDEMGYAKKDNVGETFRVINKPAVARIRHIVDIANRKIRDVVTVGQAYQRFDDVKHVYSGEAKNRLQPEEETMSGQAMVKKLTPNIMAFLAQVAKKRKSGEKWHEHLDPSNYENVRDKTIGYFTYDPHEAAKELVRLDLATETQSGTYTLNKEAIKKSVKDFKETAESLLSGATFKDPKNIDPSKAPSENERKVRQVIDFTKKHFSDRIWDMAQKNVFEVMRNSNDSVANALRFYLASKDEIASNTDSQVTAHQKSVEKTVIGTVIDFATARFILRKMKYDASRVLGTASKNVPKNFVFPKDVAVAGKVYARGEHRTKSRV